eukprot:TRINITY_DN8597_c0_g1_i1.p1 TRINITY_DN8597_c0_g1~~TRINITY_DN8597_c0_g1_i1.p1  ORF type:complete len:658 (-),score=110.60 TRINITY_DN8597_c0_g1_i1:321-2294(-)
MASTYSVVFFCSYKVLKVKSFGNTYVGVASLFENETTNGAVSVCRLALDVHHKLKQIQETENLSIGISTGPTYGSLLQQGKKIFEIYGTAYDRARKLSEKTRPTEPILLDSSTYQIVQMQTLDTPICISKCGKSVYALNPDGYRMSLYRSANQETMDADNASGSLYSSATSLYNSAGDMDDRPDSFPIDENVIDCSVREPLQILQGSFAFPSGDAANLEAKSETAFFYRERRTLAIINACITIAFCIIWGSFEVLLMEQHDLGLEDYAMCFTSFRLCVIIPLFLVILIHNYKLDEPPTSALQTRLLDKLPHFAFILYLGFAIAKTEIARYIDPYNLLTKDDLVFFVDEIIVICDLFLGSPVSRTYSNVIFNLIAGGYMIYANLSYFLVSRSILVRTLYVICFDASLYLSYSFGSRIKTNMMKQEYQSHQDKVSELKCIRREQQFVESCLSSVLLESIYEQLKQSGTNDFQALPKTFVLQLGLCDLYNIMRNLSPYRRMFMLSEIIKIILETAQAYNIELVKGNGDVFLMVDRSHEALPNRATKCVAFCYKLQKNLHKLKTSNANARLQSRLGISYGDCIGGITGKCRFSFDVWGPAVEEASNLQRICGVDQILVDEAVNRLLASDPHIETDPWVFDGHSCFFVSPPESETIQLFTNI